MNDKSYNDQKGNALLLTLLIVSAILTTAITMASLTIGEVRKSRDLSDSMAAYYAAETGIERAIFQIRKESRSIDPSDIVHIDFNDELENNGSWELAAGETKQTHILDLSEQSSVQFDLFDMEDMSYRSGAQSMSVHWSGAGVVSATLLEFPASSNVPWIPGTSAMISKEHVHTNDFILNLDVTSAYRIRLKSLKGDLRNVGVSFYAGFDGNGSRIEIPNYIVLHSVGEFDDASAAVNVELSRFVPVSAVFDYVVFSADTLEKVIAE